MTVLNFSDLEKNLEKVASDVVQHHKRVIVEFEGGDKSRFVIVAVDDELIEEMKRVRARASMTRAKSQGGKLRPIEAFLAELTPVTAKKGRRSKPRPSRAQD